MLRWQLCEYCVYCVYQTTNVAEISDACFVPICFIIVLMLSVFVMIKDV